MHRTTLLLLAAAASSATLKLLTTTGGRDGSDGDVFADMARQDLVALQAHVQATGVDVSSNPLFSMISGTSLSDCAAVLPA